MRSLFFLSLMNGAAWGGSEELWFQTALYAAKKGHQVGCAFYDWPQKSDRIQQLQKAGCTLYLFSNRGREKRNLLQRLQYKYTRLQVKRQAEALPLAHYDLCVINLGYLEMITHSWKQFYKRLPNYALLFHVHNEQENVKASRKELLRQWIVHSGHNLFASARTRVYLEQQLGITVPQAKVLVNPLSFATPEQPAPYPPLCNGNFLMVMLATLDTKRKAQDNLVKALSTAKWKQRPWQLYLYGAGEDGQPLQKLVQQLGLEQKILLKGHTGAAKQALAEAHLLLQMTHIDAMPLAVMEALAMAKPAVVSRVGDMPEWVRENENGWISNDASIEAIDQTLEKAWQDRSRWESMGRRSFELFKKRYPEHPEAFLLEQLNQSPSRPSF